MPHAYGESFTPHHLLVSYFQHVAAQSDRVVVREYGRSTQGRPLIYAIISTPENLARLDDIQQNQLRKAGRMDGRISGDPLPIVWLSYGVHGNEPGASESSIATAYELARSDKALEWLKNTLVIIDPSLNPDGHDRYIHWSRSVGGRLPNADPVAREHDEPWPGGRVNHYLFDLNRDWAWQTQAESRQRLQLYQQWMPQIHVDYHEMGHNDPYYFAPAAQPYHQYITDWQSKFQITIGKNNARYFDQEGWLYFTGEVFDLLYPSYGDTYPTFNGAVGMTYEQGGHSMAGRAILLDNGDTLRLRDRIAHHRATGLSTIEISSQNAAELDKRFVDYFEKAKSQPVGKYKSYLIKSSNSKARLKALCDLLDRNKIRYGQAGDKQRNLPAFDYRSGKEGYAQVEKGDLLISAHQSQSVLLQVLFEPEPYVADSLTYDITAWALPFAYGLEAYALKDKLEPSGDYTVETPKQPDPTKMAYAYLADWNSLASVKFLGQVLQEGLVVRRVTQAFRIGAQKAAVGSLLITRGDNEPHRTDWAKRLVDIAAQNGQPLQSLSSGFTDEGPDLGSDKMRLIDRPRVLIPSGESTDVNSFGELWYYFDQVLEYPVTIVESSELRSLDLTPFTLIVLPEGSYGGKFDTEMLQDWLEDGGRLIALGSALSFMEGRSGFALTKNANAGINKSTARHLHPYEGAERRSISNQMPGAVMKMDLDTSHPLAYGLPKGYYSLKTNTRAYNSLKDCWNVGTVGDEPAFIGFVGSTVRRKLRNRTFYAVEKKGDGTIVYLADNPLFRCFWYNGMVLLGNAVFMSEL
ncbi:MAG: M14 family metallopeptidase [Bacteroidota bacterium]